MVHGNESCHALARKYSFPGLPKKKSKIKNRKIPLPPLPGIIQNEKRNFFRPISDPNRSKALNGVLKSTNLEHKKSARDGVIHLPTNEASIWSKLIPLLDVSTCKHTHILSYSIGQLGIGNPFKYEKR